MSRVFDIAGAQICVACGEPIVEDGLNSANVSALNRCRKGRVAAGAARREWPKTDEAFFLNGESFRFQSFEERMELPRCATVFTFIGVVETDPDQGLGLDRRISG